MRHVIMGTAGHIDHGKSALVKALTGIDPDRLKEEKERGITIDLGFADLAFPEEDLTIGIVDVPGHERLVRNMLAGAGGIDFVLLVIAADEGIMPQSREHLSICNLLRIKSGLVAITKSDLVEPDWLALVTDEVKDFVRGTFLEGASIIPVSAKSGHNVERIKAAIADVGRQVEPKPAGGLFRLPVDRVFTLKGFGTVVTGTALSGSVSMDENVEMLPRKRVTKIRGMHSHGKSIKRAHAGQRVAVNLQGIEKEELHRGDTLVTAGRFEPTSAIDAKVELLVNAQPLKNRSLVHFHLGTSETIARVILYGEEKLEPGDSSYCQFRLDAPVVAQSGDRFIVRRFSPVDTIGGGEVLDPAPARRRKKDGLADLEVFESGSSAEKIAMKVRKAGLRGMSAKALEGWLDAGVDDIRGALGSLVKFGDVKRFDDVYLHSDSHIEFGKAVISRLKEFHRTNPHKHGLSKEELRTVLRMEQKVFSALVSSIAEVEAEKDLLRLKSFKASVSEKETAKVIEILERAGFQPPGRVELASALKIDERKAADVLIYMSKEGLVVRINENTFLSRAGFERMVGLVRKHFEEKPDMTVAEFRDLLGTTRKFALPFLEYLDTNNITLRVGDVRKLLKK